MGREMRKLMLAAAFSLFSGIASGEDAPPIVRKIAPERFQPSPRSEIGGSEKYVTPTLPTKERPFGSCDKSSRDWLFCLRSTADLSDALVRQAEGQVSKVVKSRLGLNNVTAQGFERELKEADVKWRALRDVECGNLAVQEEIEIVRSAYEARIVCQIKHNMERADQLMDRYKARQPEVVEPNRTP